ASQWGLAAVAGVAGAVAAGTVPDVIKGWLGDQRLSLTVLCIAAALMFAGINLWQQRSRGVGIVISLPPERWRGPWSGQWLTAAVDHAKRNHDSCFAVRRSIPSDEPAARAEALDLAYELVTARLVELSEVDPATPVSLYVNATLPDVFDLGARFKFNVQRELRGVGPDPEGAGKRPAAGLVLPQPSERAFADFFPSVRISSRLKEPLTPAEARRAESLARVVDEPEEFQAVEHGTAVAVVVHLSDNPLMISQALSAAATGCLDSAGKHARCRAALLIEGGPANIPETMADFELVVRHVYAAWRAWVAARPQYADLDHRLFIAAPAGVAFALGWLFGHTVTAVPHPYPTGESCTSS
ncbi:hypothetical protein C1I98_36000, partial [Spongiactinospora gelatinilytica]